MAAEHGVNVKKMSFLEKLRPLERGCIGILIALAAFCFLPKSLTLLVKLLVSWNAFAITYIVCCWSIMGKMQVQEIKKLLTERMEVLHIFSLSLFWPVLQVFALFFSL